MSRLQELAIRTLGSLTLTMIITRYVVITTWFNVIVMFLLIYLFISDIAIDIEEYIKERNDE